MGFCVVWREVEGCSRRKTGKLERAHDRDCCKRMGISNSLKEDEALLGHAAEGQRRKGPGRQVGAENEAGLELDETRCVEETV